MVKAEAPSLPKHRLAATLLLSRTNGRLRRPTHCAYPATNLKTRGPTPQGFAGKYVVCGRSSKETRKLAADIWNDGPIALLQETATSWPARKF